MILQPRRKSRRSSIIVGRKAKPKFYADENFPTAAMRLIRSGGFNVLTANEVELQGHPDENPRRMLLRMLGCFSPAIVTI